MVLEQVTDHEDALRRLGGRAHVLGVGHVERERLLDEDVLAGLDAGQRELRVACCGRGDGDGVDRVVGEELVELTHRDAMALRHRRRRGRVGIVHGHERAELIEHPHEVATPVPAPEDRDAGCARPRFRGAHGVGLLHRPRSPRRTRARRRRRGRRAARWSPTRARPRTSKPALATSPTGNDFRSRPCNTSVGTCRSTYSTWAPASSRSSITRIARELRTSLTPGLNAAPRHRAFAPLSVRPSRFIKSWMRETT